MKLNKVDWAVIGAICVLVFLILFVPMGASGQSLEIKSGVDIYQRDLPQTVEDGQQLAIGLTATMNAVIAAWEAQNVDASAQVKAILDGNQTVMADAKRVSGALHALPGGLLTKSLALGVYGSAEPWGPAGASATWNLWNLGLITVRAGVMGGPDLKPDGSIALEWWLF